MTEWVTGRWVIGRYRIHSRWVRFMPIHASPLWSGPRRWRDICGVGIGFGPHVFYIGRW